MRFIVLALVGFLVLPVGVVAPNEAEAAQTAGLPVQIVAREHSAAGLVAALVAHFEQGVTHG